MRKYINKCNLNVNILKDFTYLSFIVILIIQIFSSTNCYSSHNNKNFYKNSNYYDDTINTNINENRNANQYENNLLYKLLESLSLNYNENISKLKKHYNGLFSFLDSSNKIMNKYFNSMDNNLEYSEETNNNNENKDSEYISYQQSNKIKKLRSLQMFNSTSAYTKDNCNNNAGEYKDLKIGTFTCNDKTVTNVDFNNMSKNSSNVCFIKESHTSMCICSSNFEGEFCHMPIANLCGFSLLELNGINLLEHQNTFYNEYLNRKKIFLDDLNFSKEIVNSYIDFDKSNDNNGNNRYLNFTFSFNCRLLPEKTKDRVALNNSTFVNFKNNKQFIIDNNNSDSANENDNSWKNFSFKEYISSENKEIVFRDVPSDFILELSFYSMNTLTKLVSFEKEVPSQDVFGLMMNKKTSSMIFNYDSYKDLIEVGKVMGAVYFQINFRYKEELDQVSKANTKIYKSTITNNNDTNDEPSNSNYNKLLLITYIYNGVLGINKNSFYNYDYYQGHKVDKASFKWWVIALIIIVSSSIIFIISLYIYRSIKKSNNMSNEKIEKDNNEIKKQFINKEAEISQ